MQNKTRFSLDLSEDPKFATSLEKMKMIEFNFNDGGRAAAGYKGFTGDCVCRAIAIGTGQPYQKIYDELTERIRSWRINSKSRAANLAKPERDYPRRGAPIVVDRKYLKDLGWSWTPTMFIGQGCKIHLRKDELPAGRLIVRVSRHITSVIDGVLNDTHDCSRAGNRCVYGYWKK